MTIVDFETIKGKRVFNIFSESENTKKRIVIMSHGFRASSIGPARTFVDFERILLKEGYSVLRFDQPNSGNSEGNYLNSSFNEWVDTIVYFAKKYLNKNYKVALMGQSMGASATVVASGRPELDGRIRCLLLWVPDPKTTIREISEKVYEEGGQKYRGSFWVEARKSDFFENLHKFQGKIHLVYGEKDKYISQKTRERAIKAVKAKGQEAIVLSGQDHSAWEYNIVQKVYMKELQVLQKSF